MADNQDSRIALLTVYLADQTNMSPDEITREAASLLAAIDAVDPIRGPVPDEATEAAANELHGHDGEWQRGRMAESIRAETRDAILSARDVMAGESVAMEPSAITPGIFHSLTPEQQQRALNYRGPENYGDPEFRLDAALAPEPPADPPPKWTAEQRVAVLTAIKGLFVGVQNSMDVLTVRRVVFNTEQKFLAAFAKPEPVWPPTDCLNPTKCGDAGLCLNTHPLVDCPHAGESVPMAAPAAIDRLKAKAEARAGIKNEIAKILWENGEMLADTEGGSMPTWNEVVTNRRAEGISQEFKEACWSWFLAHTHQAEALLSLDAADSLTLAKHLIDSAMRAQRSIELDLWHKIERAKGFEPGSLTDASGVPQRVAL